MDYGYSNGGINLPRQRTLKEQKTFENMKSELQAYLMTCKTGMEQRALEREIVDLTGKPIDYKAMGIDCWAEFLYECRGVIEVYRDDRSTARKKFIFVRFDTLPASAQHIGALVRGQEKSGKCKKSRDGSITNPTRAHVTRVDAKELLRGYGSFTPPVQFDPTFKKSEYARGQRSKTRGGGRGGGRSNGFSSYGGSSSGHGGSQSRSALGSSSWNSISRTSHMNSNGFSQRSNYDSRSSNPPRMNGALRGLLDEDDYAENDDSMMFDYSSGGAAYSAPKDDDEWVSTPVAPNPVASGETKRPAVEPYVIPKNRPQPNISNLSIVPAGAEDSDDADGDFVGNDDTEDTVDNPIAVFRNANKSAYANPIVAKLDSRVQDVAHENETGKNNEADNSKQSTFLKWLAEFKVETHTPITLSPRPQLIPFKGELLKAVGVKEKTRFNVFVIRPEEDHTLLLQLEKAMNEFYSSTMSEKLIVSKPVRGFYVAFWELQQKWIRVEIRNLVEDNTSHVVFAYDYAEFITVNLSKRHLKHMVKSLMAVPKTAYLAHLEKNCATTLAACKEGVRFVCNESYWHAKYRLPILKGSILC